MINAAYIIYLGLIFSSLTFSLIRLWKGPTVADRLNAADVTALCCIGLVLGHGWKQQDPLWLDVALVAGLVLFVGTTATAMFLNPKHLSGANDHD